MDVIVAQATIQTQEVSMATTKKRALVTNIPINCYIHAYVEIPDDTPDGEEVNLLKNWSLNSPIHEAIKKAVLNGNFEIPYNIERDAAYAETDEAIIEGGWEFTVACSCGNGAWCVVHPKRRDK